MSDAPRFRLAETEAFEWPFTLRLPFRFGIITVTEGRQAVLRARIETEDKRSAWGVAAETLAAKWFDKDPELTDAQNADQLRRAIELAIEATSGTLTAFGHFIDRDADLVAAAGAARLNPLVAAFGAAMVDCAMLDALLKLRGVSFWAGMRANLGGMPDAGLLHGLTPLTHIAARHTVGLVDPITHQANPVADGLPETLEQVAATYGHRWWKLKVGGNIPADVDRLCRIAAVLDRSPSYRVSLDGNEQYEDAEGVVELWRAMLAEPRLHRLCAAVDYIEQPIKRARALQTPITALAALRPVIIDESDGPLDAFVTARDLGYTGVSSKACKGIWRSLINLGRCRAWGPDYFMTAEDLTTLAGVCVQQDLALVSLLGLSHVERNGHHFVDGFNGRPRAEAQRFAAAHPGLYGPDARLLIDQGMLELRSLDTPGLGASIEPDFAAMSTMPPASW